MTSMLYVKPLPTLPAEDGLALKQAEIDLHTAAMNHVDDIRAMFPGTSRLHADKACMTALLSAFSRVLADYDQQEAARIIASLPRVVTTEQAHWIDRQNMQ